MLRTRWIKPVVFILCVMPLGWLAWRGWCGDLTANPIEYITHFTGDWTIRFIVITLAITPLRRLLSLPELIRFRRMLGLYAFFYGSLHFLAWFFLDKNSDMGEIARDLVRRPFIMAGLLGLLCMVPLAITSTRGWIRRLSVKRWQLLHRLIYVTAIAGVVHYWWLVKSDIRLPALYGVLVLLLLASRLFFLWKNRSRNIFSLQLSGIQRQTNDTVSLRFRLPPKKSLGAKPGQFLTFEWIVNGKKLPRSYSISSSPLRTDYVEVTVKQQGIVSSFLNRDVKEGLRVKAHGPFGRFCLDESRHPSVVLFAGGSGITPVMSMLRYIEEVNADIDITLFYAVRTEHDVIFREELDYLQKRLSRFCCIIIASKPGTEWHGLRGHLDRALIETQLGRIDNRTFFLCGPAAFMASVKEILMSLGAGVDQIRQERFTIGMMDSSAIASTFPVDFVRSGVKYTCSSTEPLLLVAENHGIDIPCGCRVGQCGTCATRVLDGEVEMEVEDGLDPTLQAHGYRLLCVGRARSAVRLDA